MNKIVLFSNIKGGVGKTTTSAHFTEYLTEKGLPAIAVDADLQASLSRHRERELEADPEHPVPWEIIKLNTLDASKLKVEMKKLRLKDGIIVIDCPGNLNDNNLSVIYSMADLIVIPMSYDVDTIDATGIFVSVIRQMREETISILGKLGTVTPRIKQSVVIKRYSTLYPLDKYQYAAVEHAFDRIIEEINKQ